jgi:hypothetical protein
MGWRRIVYRHTTRVGLLVSQKPDGVNSENSAPPYKTILTDVND